MENEKLLRNALKANAAFSILSAAVAFAFSQNSQAVMEMAAGNGLLFGIQLLVFAIFVLYNAMRRGISRIMINVIIVLDILYVLGVLLRLFAESASVGGLTLMCTSAGLVGLFAFMQYRGLKNALSHSSTSH